QFEFGFGLGYTTFEYANLSFAPAAARRGAAVVVSVTLRNTGTRAGAEVVELFLSPHAASATPPARRLKRFAKLMLQPGESRDVRFSLTDDHFSFVGVDGELRPEPGVVSGPDAA